MKFSVVGLPHYTVWHLYEPSVDDLRHMEEMEQERKARAKEEEERQDRLKKIKDEFTEPNSQWEKDKTELEGIAKKEEEKKKALVGDESGQISPPKDPQEVRDHGKTDKGSDPVRPSTKDSKSSNSKSGHSDPENSKLDHSKPGDSKAKDSARSQPGHLKGGESKVESENNKKSSSNKDGKPAVKNI